MVFKRFFKKIGIFIPIFVVLLMSHNTYAVSTFIDFYGIYKGAANTWPDTSCQEAFFTQNIGEYSGFIACSITSFLIQTGDVSIDGNHVTISAKVNLVATTDQNDWRNLDRMDIKGLSITTTSGVYTVNPTSSSYQYYNTAWRGNDPLGNVNTPHRTLTVIFNATGEIPQSGVGKVGAVRALFGTGTGGNNQNTSMWYGGATRFYFEGVDTQPIVNFSNSGADIGQQAILDSLSILHAQNTVINRNIENISNQISEQNEKENAAIDNIDGQSSSDIPNSDSQQTTNLIGVINNFITNIGNINATNCQVTLTFPTYAGGTRIVDICQGKEKAPTIITIGSSMLLIGVFIPLAWLLLRMIYSEIRSWTNG